MTKKNKIAFLFDNSAILTNRENEKDVFMVNLEIIINNSEVYNEKQNINELISKGQNLKTSQCSIGSLISTIEDILTKYDFVVYCPISKHLSSSYNTGLGIIKTTFEDKVFIMDTEEIDIGNDFLLKDIRDWLSTNDFNEKKLQNFIDIRKSTRTAYLVISDIKHLINGGRINQITGGIARMLSIKPIIKFNGALKFHGKANDLKSAASKMVDDIKLELNIHNINEIKYAAYTTNINSSELNESILKIIKEELRIETVLHVQMSQIIQVHTGNNAFSIYIVKK